MGEAISRAYPDTCGETVTTDDELPPSPTKSVGGYLAYLKRNSDLLSENEKTFLALMD